MTRILFVCLGNICRSAAAESVLRSKSEDAGVSLSIDSAGTSDWHVGEPPYPAMIDAARRRGHQMEHQRARQLCAGDFTRFDMIFAMDSDNLLSVKKRRPAGNQTLAGLFLLQAPELGVNEVPDPYYTRDFDGALDLIETAASKFLDRLKTP